MGFFTTAALVAGITAAGISSASSQNSAQKSAKSQADTQMRMAQASQDALVAKEKAAADDLAKSQLTASNQAKATALKKKASMSRTIYTSPLGIGGTADVARKVLLGA
jgi:hypothetical protein